MITLREILLVLLCVFSFLLIIKMKDDIDNSSSRLDWADSAKGCTDSYSEVNTGLYRYQLDKASFYVDEGYRCTIAIGAAIGLHLVLLLYMAIKCFKKNT
jgi:hypothetical protein